MTEALVLDASAMVAILVGDRHADRISSRLSGCRVHVPAHFDAEVLSALGRLQRAGHVEPGAVSRGLEAVAEAPFQRHALAPLLADAWERRDSSRLMDALYLALSDRMDATIITLDAGMAAASTSAEHFPS